MNKIYFIPRQRFLILLFSLIAILILWLGGKEASWAAPGQNPSQQTIPLRDDTPTPPPPTPIPAPETPVPESEEESSDDNDDDDSAVQPEEDSQTEAPSEIQPEAGNPTPLPPQPVEPGANPDQPTQSPEAAGEGEQSPVQPAEDEPIGNQPGGLLLQADLRLDMTVSNITPQPGELITFTLTLNNDGPDTATQVIVGELLPPQLALNSMVASQGSYQIGQGRWTIDTLPAAQNSSLNIVARVMGLGVMTNTAEILAAAQADPDSIPGNASDHEDDQVSAAVLIISEPASQEENNEGIATAPGSSEPTGLGWAATSGSATALYWLYALILGVIFFVGGLFLVRYS